MDNSTILGIFGHENQKEVHSERLGNFQFSMGYIYALTLFTCWISK